METREEITIIGSGNVAWHLAVAFDKKGFAINKVISRNKEQGQLLADFVNTSHSTDLNDIPQSSSLVIIAVSDGAVVDVLKGISAKELPIVHTSGSLPISVFGTDFSNSGVFYPFQTFSKSVKTGELTFPVCLEANNSETLDLLKSYASRISNKVEELNSEKRTKLHLSGILINNFTNHLISRAFDYMDENSIDKDLLAPIMEETISKAFAESPKDVQTGPAIRGDKEIIKKHLDLLSNHSALGNIYEVISNSIEDYYSKE